MEEYAASKGRYPPIKRRMKRSLYVCTIEKGNSLINSLIENHRMEELGIVVIDEVGQQPKYSIIFLMDTIVTYDWRGATRSDVGMSSDESTNAYA